MKKLLIVLAVLSVLGLRMVATSAWGNPFLVSDKPVVTDEVTYYIIVGLPGGDIQVPYDTALNEYGLYYDIGSIPDGQYSLTVSACNVMGCSESPPFLFAKSPPQIPTGLKIIFG